MADKDMKDWCVYEQHDNLHMLNSPASHVFDQFSADFRFLLLSFRATQTPQ